MKLNREGFFLRAILSLTEYIWQINRPSYLFVEDVAFLEMKEENLWTWLRHVLRKMRMSKSWENQASNIV